MRTDIACQIWLPALRASGAAKPYEFSATPSIFLDISQTLRRRRSVARGAERFPSSWNSSDLARAPIRSIQSSCAATVLMLDCSHSMILCGEAIVRFTPGKKVMPAVLAFSIPDAVSGRAA